MKVNIPNLSTIDFSHLDLRLRDKDQDIDEHKKEKNDNDRLRRMAERKPTDIFGNKMADSNDNKRHANNRGGAEEDPLCWDRETNERENYSAEVPSGLTGTSIWSCHPQNVVLHAQKASLNRNKQNRLLALGASVVAVDWVRQKVRAVVGGDRSDEREYYEALSGLEDIETEVRGG